MIGTEDVPVVAFFRLARLEALWQEGPSARQAVEALLARVGAVDLTDLAEEQELDLDAGLFDLEARFPTTAEAGVNMAATELGRRLRARAATHRDVLREAARWFPGREDAVLAGWRPAAAA